MMNLFFKRDEHDDEYVSPALMLLFAFFSVGLIIFGTLYAANHVAEDALAATVEKNGVQTSAVEDKFFTESGLYAVRKYYVCVSFGGHRYDIEVPQAVYAATEIGDMLTVTDTEAPSYVPAELMPDGV